MRHLKIESNSGFFNIGDDEWKLLDELNKENLLILLEKALSDDFEMDEYIEESIGNQAHRLIYKSVHEKLHTLQSIKDRFNDESERLYSEAYEKYSVEVAQVAERE